MMTDGKPPSAALAFTGECLALVDGNDTDLIEHVQTIALRILVLVTGCHLHHLSSNSYIPVARLRLMDCAGEQVASRVESRFT